MALSDFLTEGAAIPSGSAVKAMTSQTVLPDWYTNYAMDILANQKAAAATPYAPYQAPRVADMTDMQKQGANLTQQASQSYIPALSGAEMATKQALTGSTLGAAQPYLNQASALNPSGAAQSYYSQATALNPAAAASPDYDAARGSLAQANRYDAVGAASPYMSNAASYAMGSTNPTGLNMAQPFLGAASGNVADVSSYMNPYTSAVVDRIADLGTRNLTDNIMPALEGRYITSGQFRGSGQLTDTMRAVRDTSNDILGQQSTALQQGYGAAQAAKSGDLSRYATLAGTAGNLGQNQQQIVAQAGQQLGALGSTLGNLTQGQQQGALSAAGIQSGMGTQAANAEQQRQQLLANIGTQMGNFEQGQQSFLGNLGQTAGNLAGADIDNRLAAGQQLAGIAGLQQQYGLTGAGALSAAGAQQQQLNQQNLNVAYEDFLRQQGYPQEQINNMLNTFKGTAAGVPSASQEYGVVPSGVAESYKPSTASQIASGLTGAAGLADVLKGIF